MNMIYYSYYNGFHIRFIYNENNCRVYYNLKDVEKYLMEKDKHSAWCKDNPYSLCGVMDMRRHNIDTIIEKSGKNEIIKCDDELYVIGKNFYHLLNIVNTELYNWLINEVPMNYIKESILSDSLTNNVNNVCHSYYNGFMIHFFKDGKTYFDFENIETFIYNSIKNIFSEEETKKIYNNHYKFVLDIFRQSSEEEFKYKIINEKECMFVSINIIRAIFKNGSSGAQNFLDYVENIC